MSRQFEREDIEELDRPAVVTGRWKEQDLDHARHIGTAQRRHSEPAPIHTHTDDWPQVSEPFTGWPCQLAFWEKVSLAWMTGPGRPAGVAGLLQAVLRDDSI